MAFLIEFTSRFCFNYTEQLNGIPFIDKISITNNSDQPEGAMDLTIEAVPRIFDKITISVPAIKGNSSWECTDIVLNYHGEPVVYLQEPQKGTLTCVLSREEAVRYRDRMEIDLRPYDESSNYLPDACNRASFVTPNHTKVRQLVSEISDRKGIKDNFHIVGYLWGQKEVLNQAECMFDVVKDKDIAYVLSKAGYHAGYQRVRMADEILESRQANCLDFSLLFASVLEAMGLHPVLCITSTHCFPGFWLEDRSLGQSVCRDHQYLADRVSGKTPEIIIFEATYAAKGNVCSFADARECAVEDVLSGKSKIEYFVDVESARKEGVISLPDRENFRIVSASSDDGQASAADTDAAVDTKPAADTDTAVDTEPDDTEPASDAEPAADTPDDRPVTDHLPDDFREEGGSRAGYFAPGKFERWKQKLLDLTASSSLLNMRLHNENKGAVLTRMSGMKKVYDALFAGQIFRVEGSDQKFTPEAADDAAGKGVLLLDKTAEAGFSTLKALRRSDLDYRDRNGAGILYITFGIVHWTDEDSQASYDAPVLLAPVSLEKSGKSFRVSYDGPEIYMNAAVLEMLRQRYEVIPDGLSPVPMIEAGYPDLEAVMSHLRKDCEDHPLLQVEDKVCIGLLDFAQHLMWNDMDKNEWLFRQHPVIKSILEGEPYLDNEIPDGVDPEVLLPLPADGSQIAAVKAALSGQSFVLHGPPGTGKSQTITTMLANVIASGSNVLFAAEKAPALKVVYDRMKNIGLSDFCLYLPAGRATKTGIEHVLEQYGHLMELAEEGESGYAAAKVRLDEEEAALMEQLELLRSGGAAGMTLEELISLVLSSPENANIIALDPELFKRLREEGLDSIVRLLRDTMYMGNLCGNIKDHPLKRFRMTSYHIGIQKEIRDHVEEYLKLLHEIDDISQKVPAADAEDVDEGLYGEDDLIARNDAVLHSDMIPGSMRGISNLIGKLRIWYDFADIYEARKKLLKRAKPSILEMNLEGFKFRWDSARHKTSLEAKIERMNLKDRIAPHILKSGFTDQDLTEILDLAAKVMQNGLEAPESLSFSFDMTRQETEKLLGLLEEKYPHGVPRIASHATDADRAEAARNEEVFARFRRTAELLRAKLGEGIPVWDGSVPISEAIEDASHWTDGLDTIREWIDYQRLRKVCCNNHLERFIKLYEDGHEEQDVLTDLRSSFAAEMLAAVYRENEKVRSFAGYRFDKLVHEYQELMKGWFALCCREIRARQLHLAAQTLADPAFSQQKIALKKMIEAAGKGVGARDMALHCGDLMLRLTPCVMATPVTTAAYFGPEALTFDKVIMDEASQLQTCKSAGLIVRGRQTIVVGDENQMPPTSFFNGDNQDHSVEFLQEDQESILKDFIALDMPDYYLKWHYRSHHESLITFSNLNYYGGRMITFPSNDNNVSKVHVVRTQGIYDRGGSITNPVEGKALADYLAEKVCGGDTRSYGVVAFNIRQQHLIEQLIDERREADPVFAQGLAAMEEKGEPLFVRNLESVQGDERDVILFTIGFGPDRDGRIVMSFGPLAKPGGWRRLNVAITRARDEMILFTSMDAAQMKVNSSTARGVADLKSFIAYAEGSSAPYVPQDAEEDHVSLPFTASAPDGFRNQICSYLKELGYQYVTDLGASSLTIDIAVVDPDDPERYMLGILLGSSTVGGKFTLYDGEVGQPAALKNQGWTLLRLWSPDWIEDPGREKRRIAGRLKEICDGR